MTGLRQAELVLDPLWREAAAEEWERHVRGLKHDPLAALRTIDGLQEEVELLRPVVDGLLEWRNDRTRSAADLVEFVLAAVERYEEAAALESDVNERRL